MKKDMTRGRELRLILLFALPIMLANLLQQLYNTVDNVIVGQFAESTQPGSFAAVGTVAPLTFLYLAFAIGLSVGVSVVCSQLFGAQQHDRLRMAVDTSVILLTVFGVIIAVIGYFITPWLIDTVLQVRPDYMNDFDGVLMEVKIHTYAIQYLQIYCIGLPFQFAYNAIASALRGVGNARASLIFLAISSVANVFLDTWFIVSFNWGAFGAAVATVISQGICVVVSYIYLRRKFPIVIGERHFDGKLCLTIVRVGLPMAIQQSIVAFGNIAMMRLVQGFSNGFTYREVVHEPLGKPIVDSFTAGSRIDMFFFVPVQGMQTAIATFVGQNIAAGRIDRVKRGYYHSLITILAIIAVICVALYFLARPVLTLFGLDETALLYGAEQVRYYASIFWVFAAYMMMVGVLQGAGDTIMQAIATLSALAIRVAIAYFGVYFFTLDYSAAWSTLLYGWVVALIITNIRFYTGGWQRKTIAKRAPESVSADIGDES